VPWSMMNLGLMRRGNSSEPPLPQAGEVKQTADRSIQFKATVR
jgi:hypothetical protein